MGSILLIIIAILVGYFILVAVVSYVWEIFTEKVEERVSNAFRWITRGRFD